jgi:acetyl esterase
MTDGRTYDFDVEDIEYLRHGDTQLLARIYSPRNSEERAAVVELHGGGWNLFDRTRGKSVHETLAKAGFFVMALDFRQGEDGAYPRSLEDISYGIRWLKANAARFNIDPNRVGISGNSSGGHLAMLMAMRPEDPRYNAIRLAEGEADASLRCVVMLWPVINPLGRYRYVKRRIASGSPPERAEDIIKYHHVYWKDEETMAEGNPMLILERREKVRLPPAMWIQATNDEGHNYVDADSPFARPESDRFADRYRRAGGEIDLEYFEAPVMFTTVHPTLPESIAALDRIVGFFNKHLRESD